MSSKALSNFQTTHWSPLIIKMTTGTLGEVVLEAQKLFISAESPDIHRQT